MACQFLPLGMINFEQIFSSLFDLDAISILKYKEKPQKSDLSTFFIVRCETPGHFFLCCLQASYFHQFLLALVYDLFGDHAW